MSKKYKLGDNDKLHFVSFAVINWIDLFIRNEYQEEIVKSITYCQAEKAWSYIHGVPDSYRETSHVHLIIGSKGNPLLGYTASRMEYSSAVDY